MRSIQLAILASLAGWLILFALAVAALGDPTPTPTLNPMKVGETRCGRFGQRRGQWQWRNCPQLEAALKPAATPVPVACPPHCPSGTFCSTVACEVFGSCKCE